MLAAIGKKLRTIARPSRRAGGTLALVWVAIAAAAPSPAADWIEVRTAHFVVISPDSEERTRTFAARLERYDQGMRILQRLREIPSDRANPVTIYVVPHFGMIAKLCAGTSMAKDKRGCRGIGGWYQGRVSGSVAFIPRPSGGADVPDEGASTMYHEYGHHFMLSNFAGAYPAWYVEGFAEFHATASFESKGMVGFGKPQVGSMRWLAYAGGLPIEKLLTSNVAALTAEDRMSFYSQGWLLTHYLTFEASRAGQLLDYLKGLNAGKSSLDAARAAFGDLRKLDRELDGYLHSSSLYYMKVPVPELDAKAITTRRLTPGEAAMMPVRLISRRGVDDSSAKTTVVEARRLAAPYPNDPGAQVALAEAEYDADDYDAAEAAADRALAAAPTNRTALVYKGMARISRLRVAKSSDAKAWQEARSWFVRANHLEPDDAWALERFYRSFVAEGVKPTKSAVAGLEAALAAVPQDRDLRLTLAMQYLHDGRKQEARKLLAALAFNPHAGTDNAARRMIALIDKDDGAAITKALQTGKLEGEDEDKDDEDKDESSAGTGAGGKSGPAK